MAVVVDRDIFAKHNDFVLIPKSAGNLFEGYAYSNRPFSQKIIQD